MAVPTSIKKLKGTLQPCRTNFDEPFPEVKVAEPTNPEVLDEIGRKEYYHKAKAMAALGCFTEWDNSALCAYAALYSSWVKIEKTLAEEGYTTVSQKNIPMRHPLVGMRNATLALMNNYLVQFGLTPVSRSKVKADKGKGKNDEWAAFSTANDVSTANVQ